MSRSVKSSGPIRVFTRREWEGAAAEKGLSLVPSDLSTPLYCSHLDCIQNEAGIKDPDRELILVHRLSKGTEHVFCANHQADIGSRDGYSIVSIPRSQFVQRVAKAAKYRTVEIGEEPEEVPGAEAAFAFA